MKTIGLIGGMSWKSTVPYYSIINEVIKEKLGGFHSGKIILYSVDFYEIKKCLEEGQWDKSTEILLNAAKNLERCGADFIVICTNTMHKAADKIQKNISIPILHIADVTADKLKLQNINRVALLGTQYTMEQEFYKNKLFERGIEAVIPCKRDREIINSIIYNELCLGVTSLESKNKLLRIISEMRREMIQGVILGCTEIGLLINQNDIDIPLFDATKIHAETAALYAIK